MRPSPTRLPALSAQRAVCPSNCPPRWRRWRNSAPICPTIALRRFIPSASAPSFLPRKSIGERHDDQLGHILPLSNGLTLEGGGPKGSVGVTLKLKF